jgi:hypothetical protein
MSSVLACPVCKSQLRIMAPGSSPQVRCPKCFTVVNVPDTADVPAEEFNVPMPDRPDTALHPITSLPRGVLTIEAPTAPQPPAAPAPIPQSRPGVLPVVLAAAKWFALGLAMALALLAAGLLLTGLGWRVLSFGAAGCASVVGLVAVLLSLVARRSMLEAAATTVFLGVAGLLFATLFVVSAGRSRDAQERVAQAAAREADALANAATKEAEIRKQQEAADQADRSVADKLKKSSEMEALAQAELQQAKAEKAKAVEAELKAAEAPQKAAQLLEQLKAEQAKIDQARDKLTAQMTAAAAELAKADEVRMKLDEQSRKAEEAKKAADEVIKKAEADQLLAKDLLDKVNKKAEADKLLAKEALEKAELRGKELMAKAELRGKELMDKAEQHGKELATKAEQKEKQAQALYKKVTDVVDAVKLKLKAMAIPERKAAITALARIGETAASADADLCVLAAFDPVPTLRQDAVAALETVQPKLYPLVAVLTQPPAMKSSDGYIGAIKQLSDFGKVGLPLIEAQLQGSEGNLPAATQLNRFHASRLLKAHVAALAKLAADETALKLLMTLPQTPLAATIKPKEQTLKNLDPYEDLLQQVHASVLSLGKEQAALRPKIVPYFTDLLQSPDVDYRLYAVAALAMFGADAKSALPALKKKAVDPSETDVVRGIMREAISKIEQAN